MCPRLRTLTVRISLQVSAHVSNDADVRRWLGRLLWVLVSHGVAGVLHVQIVLSHFAMRFYMGRAYNDASDEWYVTQLKTTMNVDTWEWFDCIHIGLQFQIEHHLWPACPQFRFPRIQPRVRLFFYDVKFIKGNFYV